MFYREAGQFKQSYAEDAGIFPIRQDRIAIAAIALIAFVAIPLFATPYAFTGVLIPFLILSLAAIGLNILTGYAGQLSLGSAAFMTLHVEVAALASSNAESIAATIRDVTKLRGEVRFHEPGALANDGKVIDDARKYD